MPSPATAANEAEEEAMEVNSAKFASIGWGRVAGYIFAYGAAEEALVVNAVAIAQ